MKGEGSGGDLELGQIEGSSFGETEGSVRVEVGLIRGSTSGEFS